MVPEHWLKAKSLSLQRSDHIPRLPTRTQDRPPAVPHTFDYLAPACAAIRATGAHPAHTTTSTPPHAATPRPLNKRTERPSSDRCPPAPPTLTSRLPRSGLSRRPTLGAPPLANAAPSQRAPPPRTHAREKPAGQPTPRAPVAAQPARPRRNPAPVHAPYATYASPPRRWQRQRRHGAARCGEGETAE